MIDNFTVKDNKLFIGKISAESLVEQYGSPLYVYDADIIKAKYMDLVKHITYSNTQIHYACKANTNVEILKLFKKIGAKIEAVSIGEILAAFAAGYAAKDIIYTCSFITKEELQFVIEKNIMINIDSLTQLAWFGQIKPGGKISLRINQGIGAGGHSHLITGGPDSKFGIDISLLDDAKEIAKKYKLKIVGVHQHIGSNILDEKIFMKAIKKLLETAGNFPDLEFIDFGGGFGVAYKPGEHALDMKIVGEKITQEVERFCQGYGRNIQIRFEAGRYLIAEAGVLLATVTDIKRTPYKVFVGLNSGMNHLIRPAMYGAYHQIVNATNMNGEDEVVSVVGNICESADFFAKQRRLTKFQIGDIAAVLDAGAYGYVMSSLYSSRPQPAEILVDNNASRIIREQRNLEITATTKILS